MKETKESKVKEILLSISKFLGGDENEDEKKEELKEEKKVELAQEKLDNGTVVEAESFEAGQPIFIVGEDENIPLPIGEYEWAGKIIVISEDGIIDEVKEAVEAEAESETSEFVTKEEFNTFVDEIKSMLSSHVKEIEKENTELKKQTKDLEKEKADLKVELEKKPDAEKIKHSPKPEKKKRYEEMSNYERLKYNRENK